MAHSCLFVWIYLVTIVARDISAIKCWRCSSANSKFCGDVLDHSNFTDNQLSWHLVRCGAVVKKLDYKGDKMIAKCMIRIDLDYDKLVYTRKCVEEAENANANSCLTDELFNDNDNPNIRHMSCETCAEEDGCNSKINNYFITETDSSLGNLGLTKMFHEPKVIFCLFLMLFYSHCQYGMRE